MSMQEGTFNLPFISNLVRNKVPERMLHGRQRTGTMKEKAICLDDDPLSLRLVEHLLKKRFDVLSCATIDSAIRAVQSNAIDLFLCDYHLGESFTGVQAWQVLSNEYGFSPMHRVLITSYPSNEIEGVSLNAGFDRVFSKPLRQEFQSYCLNLWLPRNNCPAAVV